MSRPHCPRRGVAALLLLAAALVCLPAASVMAFNPYVPPEPPPPEGCLGSNDPYCQGGGGGGSVSSCYVCDLMLEDDLDPGSAYYGCAFVDPLQQNGYQSCTPGNSEQYCRLKTFCQAA